jgi:methylenetetrahydrofolate dehydrogenase (NADP+)/methenyltetrahydrofolate cyclohydrolase
MHKELVRSQILNVVNKVSDRERVKKENDLFSRLETRSFFQDAQVVGLFVGKDHEPATLQFIKKYLKNSSKKICLPRIVGKNLEFRIITNLDIDLLVGKYSILEPADHCKLVRPHRIQLLCIPAVAVDLKGNRIGRGQGYYDHFLEKAAVEKTIALVYEEQIVSSLEVSKYDFPIDGFITEKRFVSVPSDFRKTKLINGNKIAYSLQENIKEYVHSLSEKPQLKVFLVGNNQASLAYVRKKEKACLMTGIICDIEYFPDNSSEALLLDQIYSANNNNSVTGILIQLPLPNHMNTKRILNAVISEKDVDGLTEFNSKNVDTNTHYFIPCASEGILFLLDSLVPSLEGKTIALVGYGNLVNKPLHKVLRHRKANVIIGTKATKNISYITKKADILISATGVAHLITSQHLKENAIVIDAGFSKKNGYCVGDVDFENVFSKVQYITPSPGGLGPYKSL